MENDGGRLRFSIGLDLEALRESAEKSKELLSGISTHAQQAGCVMDRAFGSMGAAQGFTTLEAAISGASKEITALDFGSAQEKIGALSYIIQTNEQIIAESSATLSRWQSDAEAAFSRGDTGTLSSITQDIDEQIAKISQLSQETDEYRTALDAVLSVSGLSGGEVSVPRLYDGEEDLRKVEELKAQINETAAEIARIGSEGGDTSSLIASFTSLKDELGSCEASAAKAAAALGEDLGGRAAEAQQALYSLNQAISEQQATINALSTAVEEARARYEELQNAGDADSEAVERAAAEYNTLSDSLRNAVDTMTNLETQKQSATATWKDVSGEIQAHNGIMARMLGGYDNYKKVLSSMPISLQGGIKGIQSMTGAARSFIATPLGACIAAIVLAIQALKAWFSSSAEGQLAFAKISGYVSGVLGQLKEIVVKVGKVLFSAFSDPKKAIKELWEVVKTNIVNRFKAIGDIAAALGKIMKAAFTLDWDGVKAGAKDLLNGYLKLGFGVDKLTDKASNFINKLHSAGKESSSIAVESKKLEQEAAAWEQNKEKLNQKMAKARGKMSNTSLSAAERKKAKKEYESALKEQTEMEKKFADKRVELQKRSMKLTSNTIEDEKNLSSLEAASEAVTTRQERQLASLERREGAIDNKIASDGKKAEEALKKQEEALKSLGAAEAALIVKNNSLALEAMQDGTEKNLRQLKAARDKEYRELEKTMEKMKDLNKKAGKATGADGLTDRQRKMFEKAELKADNIYEQSLSVLLQDERGAYLSRLKEHGTFLEKKLALDEDYARREDKIRLSSDSAEVKREKLLSLQSERRSEEASLTVQEAKGEVDFQRLFNGLGSIGREMAERTLSSLREIAGDKTFQGSSTLDNQKELASLISELEQKTATLKDVRFGDIARDAEALSASIRDCDSAERNQKNALEALQKAQKNLKDAQAQGLPTAALKEEVGRCQEAFDAASDMVRTATENRQKAESDYTSSVSVAKAALSTFGSSLKKLSSGSLKDAFEGIKGLGQIIGGKIGNALANMDTSGIVGSILGIMDILKNGLGDILSSLDRMCWDALNGILSDLLSGDIVLKPLASMRDGLDKFASTLTFGLSDSLFSSSNAARVNRVTARLTSVNEHLRYSIDRLKDSIDKEWGGKAVTDYQTAMEMQQRVNENQKKILSEQMRYSSAHHSNAYYWNISKTMTDKVNALLGTSLRGSVWKDWLAITPEQMEQIRSFLPDVWRKMTSQGEYEWKSNKYLNAYADEAGKITDLTDKIRENLLSTSFDGLKDSFLSGLMDMEKSAADFSSDFSEMMQKSLLKASLGDRYDTFLKDWYERITSAMYDAQSGQYVELTKEQVDSYRGEWDKMVSQMMDERDRLLSITGWQGKDAESTREASQKGIAQASQDSVDELNGRMTAVQGHTYSIAENTRLLLSTTNEILQGVTGIERNTSVCSARMDDLCALVRSVKGGVDDINLKGVRIK